MIGVTGNRFIVDIVRQGKSTDQFFNQLSFDAVSSTLALVLSRFHVDPVFLLHRVRRKGFRPMTVSLPM